jgi:anthranilate synthase component 1
MRHYFCHSLKEKTIFQIEQLLQSRNIASYKFSKEEGFSNLQMIRNSHNVSLAKHCFVVMFSNWYYQKVTRFKGDEFNVYRALEVSTLTLFVLLIMVIFIFGSSPEAQIIVKDRKANSSYSRNFQTNR